VPRGPGRGAGGAATSQPRWPGADAELPQTPESPLVIPDPEAESVELNGPLASLRRSPLHRHLIRRNDYPAGDADLTLTWTIAGSRDAVMR